jgi:hypothetical protein
LLSAAREKIEELIPTPMAVNCAFMGWTTRTWHQDDYLNPPWMNSWYLAVGMSLAKKTGALRSALIAHYSSIVRRTEMPLHRRHKDGCFYFVFQKP